jgi:hypothetical protein
MEPIQPAGCGCEKTKPAHMLDRPELSLIKIILVGSGLLGLWFIIYSQLKPFASFATFSLLGLEEGSHFGEAVKFFIYDVPKVLMLLVLVVFFIGVLRSFFTPERTRRYLAGKRESAGNVTAALLGGITPFCSCSAVPLFIGFVQSGVPLGVTFSFLIAAPMVSEIALIMLYALLGWEVALLYAVFGLTLAVVGGWIIGRFGLEEWMEGWVQEVRNSKQIIIEKKLNRADRIEMGKTAVIDIVGRIWLFVVIGIGIGAFIHGYVPEEFMIGIMGEEAPWWSVIAAVVAGIPMYSSAAGMIPVMEALLGKGAALGTVLAFMMSVIALSLPEIIILRKVLKPKLIAVFVGVVGAGILGIGYLFNWIL